MRCSAASEGVDDRASSVVIERGCGFGGSNSDVEGVDGQRYYEFFVERSMLRAGANVLAAQVHQSAADSPDLTFDFELVDYLRDLDKTTFRVRTRSQDHNYAPANCGAIWIEDEFGAHVRTLKVWADRRLEHLVHWRKSIGAYPADDEPEIPVDALSGATLDAHATHKVDWDGRDFLGQFVPHGAYRVQIEVTEDNANDREHQFRGNPTTGFEVIPEGALYSVAFTVGDAAPTHIVAADTAAALEFMAIPGSPPAGDPRPSACPGYCEHIASCQLVDPGNCMTSCAPEQIRALLHSPQCDTKVNELLACASALDCDALALFVQGVEPNPCAQLQAERDGPLCRVPGASLRLDEPFLADRAGTKQPRLAVVLDARPNSVVSVPVGVTPVGEITLTPSSLTFTPDNWNIPQFVTGTGRVTGSVGDVRVTVELGASASLDLAFDGQKWGGLRGYIAD